MVLIRRLESQGKRKEGNGYKLSVLASPLSQQRRVLIHWARAVSRN
jgi:hypothetical protein